MSFKDLKDKKKAKMFVKHVQRDNNKKTFDYKFIYNNGVVVTLTIPHSAYKIVDDKIVYDSEWENRIQRESLAMAKANSLDS